MAAIQTVFKRYEKKYLLNTGQYEEFLKTLNNYMSIDTYGESLICNIYYDTPDFLLIRRSLEKPIYKEKLRLRSYGVPTDTSTGFVELKKKYDDVVYKRRITMQYANACKYLSGEIAAPQPSQISNEIDWVLGFYRELSPAVYISYLRTAYFCESDPNLRITFDRSILWRNTDLDLRKGSYGSDILLPGQRLMEVKIPGTMPLWMAKEFDRLKIYSSSFSKYGNAYRTMLTQNTANIGGIFCA